MARVEVLEGGCLCGAVRYRVTGAPTWPHLCSCSQCRRWSGAPTVAWLDVAQADLTWTGRARPRLFRSSERTQRGNCPTCGSALCAVDDGSPTISLVIGSLDRPNRVVPDGGHSYRSARPRWWQPAVGPAPKPT